MTASPVNAGRRRIALLAALAATLLLAIAAADARAGITGSTTLKPDRGTFEGLADMGIKAKAMKPATAGTDGFTFPITGGGVVLAGSRVFHRGGLEFKRGKKSVAFKNPTMNLSAQGYSLDASVGNKTVEWMKLNFNKARSVSDTETTNIKATLARPAAHLLSKVFNAKFKTGIPLGKITLIVEGT